MILQSLTAYYQQLGKKGAVARFGWGSVKVSYALEMDDAGTLVGLYPLKVPNAKGKKMVAQPMELPAPVKRSMGVSPNFLCDNSSYLLGFDAKGNPDRTQRCWEAAKKLHLSLLSTLEHPAAKALCAFFEQWDPKTAREHPLLIPVIEDLEGGANLVFLYQGVYLQDDPEIAAVWEKHYDGGENSAQTTMRCLVSGELTEPMAIHPSIKGIRGAQSSGAALVSFNAAADCSYNREQNLNAPVGKQATFAYTTALNYLIAARDGMGRPKFSCAVGDTTVVFWAEDARTEYQEACCALLEGDSNILTNTDLKLFVEKLTKGEEADWSATSLQFDNKFYIMGLSPNAARLSVRFFLQDSFGHFAEHLQAHYQRLRIVAAGNHGFDSIPFWKLLSETVNQNAKDKSPSPQMTGDTLRAILSGGRYPATLYQQTLLRIKAEHDINRYKAAILKAYLLKNLGNEQNKEALTVELNQQTTYQPYVLGRLFSILEYIQASASGVTSIKDKYFTSASTTPAVVFPIIMGLAEKHLRKLDQRRRDEFSKQLIALTALLTESYPTHLPLHDQGIFQLGYYHQTQKR